MRAVVQELLKLADELFEHGKLFFHAPTKIFKEINGSQEEAPSINQSPIFEGRTKNKGLGSL